MDQVVVDSVEREVDRIFRLVVHTHAAEHLYAGWVGSDTQVWTDPLGALVHLFELKDESIPFVEFAQVGSIGTLLIKDFGDVGGFDFAGVAAHRDAFVIDFLLEHPGREEHVE